MIKKLEPITLAKNIIGVQPMDDLILETFMHSIKKIQMSDPNIKKFHEKYKFSRAKWYDAEFDGDNFYEVIEWTEERFGKIPKNVDAWTRWYRVGTHMLRFRDEKDYIMFVLRWGK